MELPNGLALDDVQPMAERAGACRDPV